MMEERGGADGRSYPSCTHEVGLHVLGRVRCGQQMGGGQNSASPPIRVLLYHVLRCLGGLRSHLVHVEDVAYVLVVTYTIFFPLTLCRT